MVIATELGLSLHKRAFGPCPHCGIDQRGSTDKRQPCGVNSKDLGFKCHQCGGEGDVLDLAALHLFSHKVSALDTQRIDQLRVWFENQGYVTPKPGFRPWSPKWVPRKPSRPCTRQALEVNYPPSDELRRFWNACSRPALDHDTTLRSFLERRVYSPTFLSEMDIARVSPHRNHEAIQELKWWPRGRAYHYRLLTPGFHVEDGRARGMHARNIVPLSQDSGGKGLPKDLWHRGTAKGLVFANPLGRHLLQRKEPEYKALVVTEGVTDFWSMSLACYSRSLRWVILGCTNGNFQVLDKLPLDEAIPVIVASDPDKMGDVYAQRVATALPHHKILRLPLDDLGAADVRPT